MRNTAIPDESGTSTAYCNWITVKPGELPHGVLLEILDDNFRPYTFDDSTWGEMD